MVMDGIAAKEHRFVFPFCWLTPWDMGPDPLDGKFFHLSRICVLQYTVVIAVCTVITFATQYAHKYNNGSLSARGAYP